MFGAGLKAQEYQLIYQWEEECHHPKIKKYLSKSAFKDSLELTKYLFNARQKAFKKGFLAFSIDSLTGFETKKCTAYVYLGNPFNSVQIRYQDKYHDLLKNVHSKYLDKTLSILDLERENQRIVEYLQNNAYPFAKVHLDSICFVGDTASAFLNIERGVQSLFGKITIKGNLKLSKSFLYGYTGIKPGKPYNHKKVEALEYTLSKLNFVQIKQTPQITIDSNKVDIQIDANKKKGNRFDGILGVLPNDKTTGKMLITGELNIYVQNLFRNGESLAFNWKKLQSSSQDLDIQATVPYIAGTAFGLNTSLNIHKQDSSFLNTNSQASLLYFFKGVNYIGLQYQLKNSSVLNRELPATSGFQSTRIGSYGLVLKAENLDFPINPMRGYSVEVKASVGNKQVKQDQKPILQSEGIFKGKIFIPLFKQSTILISNQTASIISESIYNNELFRIGGLSTLRGFMESSIFASSYSIFNLEYRFIFESKSALFAFVNGGWIEKNQQNYFQDTPWGFGLGMFFSTKAGIFSISYALGKQKNENIQLKNSKIHFGIINRF